MIKPKIIIVIVLIAIFIWTMFAPPKILPSIKMNLANIARGPLEAISLSAKHINRLLSFLYIDREKSRLRERINSLEREAAELRELALENKRLKEVLGLKTGTMTSSIPAVVIGRDPNSWSSVIFIDKGERNGIKKDTVIISSQGLAGRVRETGKNMSKIMLINDVDSKVAAVVQRSREQGLLIGTADGRCRLIYLSLDSDVSTGDKIFSSGMGGVYQKGIFIGEVVRVGRDKAKLYKFAVIKPSSELSKLEEVLCVR